MSDAVRPYYLLGRRRLALLEAEVQATLAPLVERWWPRPAALTVAIENLSPAAGPAAGDLRFFARRDDAWLALVASEQEYVGLAEDWLGCTVATSSDLVRALLRTFGGELFAALADRDAPPAALFEPDAHPQSVQLPPDMARPGAGTLALDIAIGGGRLRLLASAALWPTLAEQPRGAVPPLAPCSTALGECRVALNAMLPAVRLPLPGIATLAVGDFLNLGHDLSGTVQLRGVDAALALSATLGRRASHKAIRIGGA